MSFSTDANEQLMNSRVISQFGVEGCDELVALSGGDNMTIMDGQDFHVFTHLFYIWGADKGHGNTTYAFYVAFTTEAAELSTVGVAMDGDVHRTKMLLVEHDKSGTGAEDGKTLQDGVTQRIEESFITNDAHHGGALTTGDDEPVLWLIPVIEVADEE